MTVICVMVGGGGGGGTAYGGDPVNDRRCRCSRRSDVLSAVHCGRWRRSSRRDEERDMNVFSVRRCHSQQSNSSLISVISANTFQWISSPVHLIDMCVYLLLEKII